MSYDESKAARYEDDSEHMLPPEEADAWLREMRGWSGANRGRLLDIGAGTGLLTSVMKNAGYDVIGLEPSRPMIDEALLRHPTLTREDFVESIARDARLFAEETFDWIVSRQVLCHVESPAKSFQVWHRWLKPGGRLMLVDGFWRKSAWQEASLSRQPFAALTSATPVADGLRNAGFVIRRAGPFGEMNLERAGRWPDTATRYVVIAFKPVI